MIHRTTGLRFRANRVILTSTAPFAFTGRMSTNQSHHYLVMTAPSPPASCLTQVAIRRAKGDCGSGGNAKSTAARFCCMGFPILYFPFATHPVIKNPAIGFLMPSWLDPPPSNVMAMLTTGHQSHDGCYRGAEVLLSARLVAAGEFAPGHGNFLRGSELFWSDRPRHRLAPLKEGGENVRLNSLERRWLPAVANIDT